MSNDTPQPVSGLHDQLVDLLDRLVGVRGYMEDRLQSVTCDGADDTDPALARCSAERLIWDMRTEVERLCQLGDRILL